MPVVSTHVQFSIPKCSGPMRWSSQVCCWSPQRTEGLRPFAGLITHVCGKRSECIIVVQCLMTDQLDIINVSNQPEAQHYLP